MKKTILILFFSSFFSAFAQQTKIDSLENVLKTAKEDTSKINTLNALSRELIEQGGYENAMQYAKDALALANSLPNGEGWGGAATAYNIIGIIYVNQGNYDKAVEKFFASLKIKEDDALWASDQSEAMQRERKQGIASLYNNIGLIYDVQGNYDKALENYFASLKIKEEIGVKHPDDFWNKKGIAASYNNIGSIYDDQGNYDKALENYFASLKIKEEIGDKKGIATSYNNIGIIYKNQGNSASLAGNALLAADNYDKALENYFASLKIREEIGDKNGMTMSYGNIGMVNAELKKFAEAEKWLNKSLELSKEIGTNEWTKNAYENLSYLDSVQGNWKGAYENHRLYSEIKDSMFNEESSKQIHEMSTKYETEKKELQIENLNKDNAIKETEIKKQNFQKLAFASGFGLMLILAFVIFRGYKQKQKANEIITAQKTEVEKQKEIVEGKNNSLQVAYKHIEEKNTEILDSIRYAKRIQEAILPPQKLVQTYLEQSFILYKPKDIVAGDFYWFENVNGQTLFASVDCTGHGVPGAFVSILGYNGLNRCVKEFGLTKPSEILDKLCELVDETFSKSENDIKDGMDIALCNLSITNPERVHPAELQDGVIQYAGAGNSLYHIRNGALTEYSPDKQPIGKFAYRKPFTNHEIQLEKGDSIYIFTDGYADQFGGPKGKKFKYKQFENLLHSIQDRTMTEQREILNETIEEWKGEMEQVDDICVMGVRV